MRKPLRLLGLRFSTGHSVVVAALTPLVVLALLGTRHQRWGIGLLAALVMLAFVTVRGRRLVEWVGAVLRWVPRRRRPVDPPSEPVVGATVMPGDHVAVRWHGDVLVALIELVARPFTPTVIVDGAARTDDVVETTLVESLLSVHCPDLEAEVVSVGHRVGTGAPDDVVAAYHQAIDSDPAPVYRRTWIVLRADPSRAARSAQRRDSGIQGVVRYLVAAATRMADGLARQGVDARCSRSFDTFDQATEIDFHRETWSRIRGNTGFTAAYLAAGGPDVWWSVPALRTVARVRITATGPPRSGLVLITADKTKSPKGFSRLFGSQRSGVRGEELMADRHWTLPIGSAGLLIGESVRKHRVYLPFGDVDASVEFGDAAALTQFVTRAAAAGAHVTLRPAFGDLALLIGAQVGPEARVAWAGATTYFEPRPGLERVTLSRNTVSTPQRRELVVHPIALPEENRYLSTLPTRRPAPVTVSAPGD